MTTIAPERHVIAKTSSLIGIATLLAILVAAIAPHHDVIMIGYVCAASCAINAVNAVSAKRRSTGLAGAFTAISLVSLYGAVIYLAPQIASLFVH